MQTVGIIAAFAGTGWAGFAIGRAHLRSTLRNLAGRAPRDQVAVNTINRLLREQ